MGTSGRTRATTAAQRIAEEGVLSHGPGEHPAGEAGQEEVVEGPRAGLDDAEELDAAAAAADRVGADSGQFPLEHQPHLVDAQLEGGRQGGRRAGQRLPQLAAGRPPEVVADQALQGGEVAAGGGDRRPPAEALDEPPGGRHRRPEVVAVDPPAQRRGAPSPVAGGGRRRRHLLLVLLGGRRRFGPLHRGGGGPQALTHRQVIAAVGAQEAVDVQRRHVAQPAGAQRPEGEAEVDGQRARRPRPARPRGRSTAAAAASSQRSVGRSSPRRSSSRRAAARRPTGVSEPAAGDPGQGDAEGVEVAAEGEAVALEVPHHHRRPLGPGPGVEP